MKATVHGNALVVTSSMKAEDIAKIQKYRPEALYLYEEKDGVKDAIFYVGTNFGKAAVIEDLGIVFNGTTHDENKLATATVVLNGNLGNVKETIADLFGVALTRLQKLEETLPTVLAAVSADREALLAAIDAQ